MNTKKLLLIDRDENNQSLVKFGLEMNAGWEVLTAFDGIEGITLAKLTQPDVILLDLVMPDLDGLRVCEILKSNLFTCTIPVIFITTLTHQILLSRLKTTLSEGIILKPFDVINLDLLIAKICDWQF